MKQSLESVLTKLKPATLAIRKYLTMIFLVSFLGAYAFLVMQISALTNAQPDPATVNDRLQVVKRLRIDQDSIDKILELEEQNIEVKALFEQARNNPFTE